MEEERTCGELIAEANQTLGRACQVAQKTGWGQLEDDDVNNLVDALIKIARTAYWLKGLLKPNSLNQDEIVHCDSLF